MNKVEYRKFFKNTLNKKYESTREVVDSLFTYERLLNYRFRLTKGQNYDYWFLSNKLDELYNKFNYYKIVTQHGRSLPTYMLIQFLSEFKYEVLTEYKLQKVKNAPHVIRDTIKLVNIWLDAVRTIKNTSE